MAKPLLQYNEAVAAEGGTSTNRQTGLVTTAPVVPLAPITPTVATPPSTTAIPMDQLGGSSQALKLPGVSTETSQADGMVAGAEAGVKTTEQRLKDATPPETESSKQAKALFGDINALLPTTTNKASDQLTAEKQQGIPDLKTRLADVNALITSRLAEYNKQIAGADLAPGETPLPIVRGRQAVIQRNQASDIGLLQARALGLQGQVEMAQDTADRAIDLKYATIEDTINVKMKQLELLQPTLDKEEARFAEVLKQKYEEEQVQLAEKKAKSKENIALAFATGVTSQFANKGGELFRTSDGKPYGSPEEFFQDAGVSSFEEAYRRGIIADISPNQVADAEFASQARAKYWDADINIGDSQDTIAQKIQSSAIWKAEQVTSEEGFTLSEGQTRYDANGNIIAGSGTEPIGAVSPYQAEQNQKILSSVDELLAKVSNSTVGVGSSLKNVPGTPAANFDANVATLKSAIAFGQLQAMREASKSGGALGAISEKELTLLESALGALDTKQSPESFKANLQKIKESVGRWNTAIQGERSLQWQDPATGDTYQFPDQGSLDKFKTENGISFNSAGNASASKTLALAPVIQKSFPQGSVGGQCGDWVRKVVSKLGATYPALGNSLKSKTDVVRKFGTSVANARVGSVIVTKENPTYGHVAYIIGKNAKGWVVGESNFKQSNKVSYGRTIPFNSPAVIGVINPKSTA